MDKTSILMRGCLLIPVLLIAAGCSSSKTSMEAQDPHIGLINYDFENGRIEPWMPYQSVHAEVSSSQAHGGKYSLAESAGYGSVYQDVTKLQAGAHYTVTAWVSASPGATATAQIAVYDASTDAATFSAVTPAGASWTLVRHDFKLGATGVARVHLFRNEGTGTLYWDDVRVARAD